MGLGPAMRIFLVLVAGAVVVTLAGWWTGALPGVLGLYAGIALLLWYLSDASGRRNGGLRRPRAVAGLALFAVGMLLAVAADAAGDTLHEPMLWAGALLTLASVLVLYAPLRPR